MRFGVVLFMLALLGASGLMLWHSSNQQMLANDITDEHELVFFSAPWCGYCDRARDWFDAEGINYLEIDIEASTDGNRLWCDAGGRGVPLVLIGDQRIPGYAPAAYAGALRENAVVSGR